MAVTLNIVETTTSLGIEVVEVVVASATTPGPAGEPGSTTLAGLDDVTLTGLAMGDRLEYDGADWVNTASAAVGLHGTSHQDGGTDEISIAGLAGTSVELAAHLADTADAHDASAISIADAGNDFTATDVEGALAELQADHEADSTALSDHIADATAAHAASAISFTPDGSIAATTVQAAIVEVRDEAGGGGAPTDVDYLVGTASAGLSAEIVVGATPGGELGGTWASPTVDATHSGSSHAGVQAAAEATAAAALDAHVTDATDAHDATAVSVDSTNLSGTSITVQGSLEELDNLLDDHSARHENGGADEISIAGLDGTPVELTNHLNDTSAAHAASAISADSTTLVGTGTDVQAVLEELDNGIADHLADTSDAHDASAISVLDTAGDYTATDVEGVLAEIAPQLGGGSSLMVQLFESQLGADAAIIDTGGGGLGGSKDILHVFILARTTEAAVASTALIRFNNDSGANYDRAQIRVLNATVAGANSLAQTSYVADVYGASAETGAFVAIEILIPGYRQTVTHKMFKLYITRIEDTAANASIFAAGGRWKSTAAIDRVSVAAGSGDLLTGSAMWVYEY